MIHTGFVLFDKYFGDALYAAMVCVLLRLCGVPTRPTAAVAVIVLMTGIELFQRTLIPERMLHVSDLATRPAVRLIGTQFSDLALLAYDVVIGVVAAVDRG